MINEIQPKIKFQNIVQCPFNTHFSRVHFIRGQHDIEYYVEYNQLSNGQRIYLRVMGILMLLLISLESLLFIFQGVHSFEIEHKAC